MAETANTSKGAAICPAIRAARPSHSREGTMVKFSDAQRAVLIQAFPAVAHVAAGGLVFGQFLRGEPFSTGMALAGVGVWIGFVSVAVMLARKKP
jgi:hypothetical protein